MTAAALQVCTDIPRHKGLTHTNTHTLGSHASCFIFIKQRLIHPLHSLCIPLLKPKLLQVHSQNELRYKNWGKHMERSWICVHGLVRESLKVRENAGTCRGKQKHIRHRERMNKKRTSWMFQRLLSVTLVYIHRCSSASAFTKMTSLHAEMQRLKFVLHLQIDYESLIVSLPRSQSPHEPLFCVGAEAGARLCMQAKKEKATFNFQSASGRKTVSVSNYFFKKCRQWILIRHPAF